MIQKINNEQTIKMLMAKSFALRSHELLQQTALIADFNTRWQTALIADFNTRWQTALIADFNTRWQTALIADFNTRWQHFLAHKRQVNADVT